MSKIRKIWRLRRLIILILIIVSIVSTFFLEEKEEPIQEITYTVMPGDTLWSIAKKNMRDDENILNVMIEIKKINNIDDEPFLKVGQELRIIKR